MAQMEGDTARQRRLAPLLATAEGRYDFAVPAYLNSIYPDIQPMRFRDWFLHNWASVPWTLQLSASGYPVIGRIQWQYIVFSVTPVSIREAEDVRSEGVGVTSFRLRAPNCQAIPHQGSQLHMGFLHKILHSSSSPLFHPRRYTIFTQIVILI